MNKKEISKDNYNFLKKELTYAQKKEIISEKEFENIMNLYEQKNKLNFIKVLLTVGALLIGLGVLSFIASNWQVMSKVSKFSVIIFFYLAINFAAWKLMKKNNKLAVSLVYVGCLIYGSGIFLIGQMFNFGGHYSDAFLYWCIGILPVGIILKDKIIYIFAHLLSLIYLNGQFDLDGSPYVILTLLIVFYYFNKDFGEFSFGTFLNNLVLLNTILYFLIKYNIHELYIAAIFFIIGLVMYLKPVKLDPEIFILQGNLVFGIAGLILTFKGNWNIIPERYAITASIIFALLYLVFLLFLTNKGNIISLVFICLTIFRYYFDTFYNFMPKSAFFIIGGLILLGFGYHFEKLRKRGALDAYK
ncbi:Uncharacterized membrane protein [Desulfonispora thiosulfatigenes DSM 11270]|uniref:Uncharacterized membrane protein n=1 Tax=Desulfonispora thiosulfatigenes DSM 11270 TaxID=656914 RepID=A0A1W1VCI5_DESTI|nr:DUF2157 domain-containing protein [Desulfonispora thiosulfatigenes]SMB91035.1 Uncharacterized membrane protein [Desulfonispora thiosulfatigenes DSM 11270]